MNLCKLKVSHFLAILNLVCLRNVASTPTPSIVATGQTHQSITFQIDDATNPTIAQLSSNPVSGSAFVENTDGTFTLSGLDAGNCYVITYDDGTAYTQTICTYLEVTQLAGATTTTGFKVVISADTGSVESGSASIDGGTTITGTVADPNVIVAFTGLTAGTPYTVDATGTLANPNSNVPANHEWVGKGEFCTVPEPVSTAVVSTADGSVTTTGAVLTVAASTTVGANPISVIAVTPTCGGTAETVQYPTCDGDSDQECELTGLTPGCEYTFAVTMICGRDQSYTMSSSVVDVTACTKPSTIDTLDYDQITITTTSFNILDDHVIPASGTFESFVIKSVQGGAGTSAISSGLVEGLEAGNCYTLNMALKCGDLEGDATDEVLCTKHKLIVGADMSTTDTITFSWPLNDASLTSTTTTVSSYKSKVGDNAEVDQLTATGTVVTIDSQTPGSVISVSTIFGYSQTQTVTAGPSDFCLKPNPATQGTLVVATDSIGFSGLGVTSGEFAGHSGSVTGCNTVSDSSTDATLTFGGLTPACVYDVTIQSYCQPSGAEGTTGQIMSEELTLKQCTKPLQADFSVSEITNASCTITVAQPTDGNAEYYTFAFKLDAVDPNVFEAFQSTMTFEDLTPSSDYTIYATVQYDDPNADAVESDVREMTCRTNERSNTRSAGTSVQATLVPLIFTLLGVGSLRALL